MFVSEFRVLILILFIIQLHKHNVNINYFWLLDFSGLSAYAQETIKFEISHGIEVVFSISNGIFNIFKANNIQPNKKRRYKILKEPTKKTQNENSQSTKPRNEQFRQIKAAK